MALKRYSVEELTKIVEDIVVDELANGHQVYFNGDVLAEDENKTILEMYREDRIDRMETIRKRITEFGKMRDEADKEHKESFDIVIKLLNEELEKETNGNLKNNKKLYNKDKNPLATSTILDISLNKKINALYDDFSARVVFLDDITNMNVGSNFDDFCKLTDRKERTEFLKNHIEITHLALVSKSQSSGSVITWKLYGTYNKNYSDITNSNCDILPSRFLDFNELTMADTMDIANNDIRQIVQTKVDIDKENLKVLAQKVVRGDEYQILDGTNNNIFIRYVCPSTGRVYFNPISERNLQSSKFYKKDNYDSYIDAWWNITHLGANPLDDVEVIRC